MIPQDCHQIDILTCDYKHFVDELCASKLIISSTLHGLILAEVYGIPAILLTHNDMDMFKYRDYYYSTGSSRLVMVQTVQETLYLNPHLFLILRSKNQLKKYFPKTYGNVRYKLCNKAARNYQS